MSSIARAQAGTIRRPPTVTAAIALLALTSALVLLAGPLLVDAGGAGMLAIGLAFAALRLVAATELWRCRRRAAILGIAGVMGWLGAWLRGRLRHRTAGD